LELYLRLNQPPFLRALFSEGEFMEMRNGEIHLIPNTKTHLYSRTGEFEHDVNINEQGIRDDRPVPLKKPPNEYRIAFLGDSFAFGYGSEFTNTIPYLVECQLNRKDPTKNYRSLNFGFRSGNCPRPQYVFFHRELPKYEVDEIYWMFFLPNDLEEMNYFQIVKTDSFGLPAELQTPIGTVSSVLKKFALWQVIRVPLKALISARKAKTPEPATPVVELRNRYASQVEEIGKMAEVMQKTCIQNNQRLRILFVNGGPVFWDQKLSFINEAQLELMKKFDALKIPYLDLEEIFEGKTSDKIYPRIVFLGDGHLTPLGNQKCTELIVKRR
jgi:hypothetical protein